MRFIKKKSRTTFYLIATSDIAFLLLIFLVVTASLEFSQEITPPETPYVESLTNENQPVTIEVTSQGKYSLLSYSFTLQELPMILSSVTKDTIIQIYADKSVDFKFILELLDSLKKENRNNVFLMMEKGK